MFKLENKQKQEAKLANCKKNIFNQNKGKNHEEYFQKIMRTIRFNDFNFI